MHFTRVKPLAIERERQIDERRDRH
jgi:hypothetical protein